MRLLVGLVHRLVARAGRLLRLVVRCRRLGLPRVMTGVTGVTGMTRLAGLLERRLRRGRLLVGRGVLRRRLGCGGRLRGRLMLVGRRRMVRGLGRSGTRTAAGTLVLVRLPPPAGPRQIGSAAQTE